MYDIGNEETEKAIAKLEKKIAKEYRQANKELTAKWKDYRKQMEEGRKKQLALYRAGEITKQDYQNWCVRHIAMGERWEAMRDAIASDLTKANQIAKGIVLNERSNVYAINHNWSTFQVMHDGGFSYDYTLYSKDTVNRLLRDNPQLLPDPSEKKAKYLDEHKDLKWNMKQVQSAVIQSILQGEGVVESAKRLEEVTEKNFNAAMRNARTSITGAQNAGRIDAYRNAEKKGIKLKKEWMATLDTKTRHEHRLLDGQRQPVDKPFEVAGEELMFPGDPTGKPFLVYNCRCTLVSQIEGLEDEMAKELDPRHKMVNGELVAVPNDKMKGMTYDQWKHQLEKKKNEPATAQPATFKDGIDSIKKRIADAGGVITENDLKEAGSLLRQEYEAKAKAWELEHKEEELDLIMKTSEAMDARNAAREHYYNMLDQYGWMDDRTGKARAEFFTMQQKCNLLEGRLNEIRNGLMNENAVDWLTGKLSEIREIGLKDTSLYDMHLLNPRATVRKDIIYAFQHYPTDWVMNSVNGNPATGRIYTTSKLRVSKVKRGYYDGFSINISGTGMRAVETAFHEIGHRFEEVVPGILDAETAFYDRRTSGEELKWLGPGYERSEVSRLDQFIHAYMGKDYKGKAYELVSMGFEYAYMNPAKLATDKDMQEWIYGLLCLR